jgi:hypothetical protein
VKFHGTSPWHLRRERQIIFSKIEQVKKLEDVLKSSAPKDTEVIASMAATDLIRSQSRSVEFGQSNFVRRKNL